MKKYILKKYFNFFKLFKNKLIGTFSKILTFTKSKILDKNNFFFYLTWLQRFIRWCLTNMITNIYAMIFMFLIIFFASYLYLFINNYINIILKINKILFNVFEKKKLFNKLKSILNNIY